MLPAPRGSFLHFCRSVAVGMPPLTLGQQTYCAIVFDRREPGSLEGEPREIARQLFGPDVDTVPPVVRRAVVTLKGLRTGGTLLHSVYLLYAALTSKIQNLGPGEVASCMIASPTLALSAQSYRYCLGVAENTPSIARLIEAQTSTRSGGSLTIRRPDGIAVCIETAAKSEGGAATRGRTVVAALIDEAALLKDAETGVMSDAAIFQAIRPRLIEGGLISVISTAYGEYGIVWETVAKQYNNPQTALACRAPTLLLRPDKAEDYALAVKEDPQNAEREYNCKPLAAAGSSFFDPAMIDEAVDTRLELPLQRSRFGRVGVGVDTALVSDSSAFCAVRLEGDTVTVLELVELKPTKHRPLKLSEVCQVYSERMLAHGARSAAADHHELEASKEHMAQGLTLVAAPGGQAAKLDQYLHVRVLLNAGRLKLPKGCERLIRQMKAITAKPTPGGGIKISSPRANLGGHGDLCSAMILAVHNARARSSMQVYLETMELPKTNKPFRPDFAALCQGPKRTQENETQ